uniref:Uncharacterized protein n=1 Tax=Avena sativa TaxID=4498 RepID=A0ACD6A119_AVESA
MAAMASTLLPLLLFSAIVCTAGTSPTATAPTVRAQRGKPNTSPPAALVRALVQSTCNATTYYDLCVATMVADPSSSTADLSGLCAIALSAAAANASATQAALANTTSSAGASEPSDNGRVRALFRACAGKYGEAREALLEARESVGEEAYDDAFVQVSAAAEYPAVCRTLFRRRRVAYPAELARREEVLERLCTVAIDIITLLF